MQSRLLAAVAVVALVAFALVGAGSWGSPRSMRSQLLVYAHVDDRSDRSDRVADLYVARSDGSHAQQLTRTPSLSELDPSWSPDGSRVVFARATAHCQTRSCQKEGAAIWVMAADGSGARRVTTSGLYESDGSPTWSPDGRRIAFVRRSPDYPKASDGLYVIGADGRGLRALRLRNAVWLAEWQPRGQKLALVTNGGNIELLDARTRQRRRLKIDGLAAGGAHAVTWAPSGRRLAVASDAGVHVVRASGDARG
jgi:TolB protein